MDFQCELAKRTDFELSLNTSFAALTIVRLGAIVLRHDFDEFPGERRVLRFAYSQIGRRFIRLLLMFDVLLYDYKQQQQHQRQEKTN